jgi:hypothetical protein
MVFFGLSVKREPVIPPVMSFSKNLTHLFLLSLLKNYNDRLVFPHENVLMPGELSLHPSLILGMEQPAYPFRCLGFMGRTVHRQALFVHS